MSDPLSTILSTSSTTDPFGILASTGRVMARTDLVRIDDEAIETLVISFGNGPLAIPPWDATLHYRGHDPDHPTLEGIARTAGWIFALDALNFCFWAQGDDPNHRWKIAWRDQIHDGYDALAAALTRAAEGGIPIWDADWLATIDQQTLHAILRPIPGSPDIPLFDERVNHLRELGMALLAVPGNPEISHLDAPPVIRLLQLADGSAMKLVSEIVHRMPSFRDYVSFDRYSAGRVETNVVFLKRAQILVADLAGALEGHPLCTFHDLDTLTAFADYKVPQVLRNLGIIHYTPALAERIDHRELIPAGSMDEIAIRAATVQACERIRLAFAARDQSVSAFEIDWLLWKAGQTLPKGTAPYHRTVTIFY